MTRFTNVLLKTETAGHPVNAFSQLTFSHIFMTTSCFEGKWLVNDKKNGNGNGNGSSNGNGNGNGNNVGNGGSSGGGNGGGTRNGTQG